MQLTQEHFDQAFKKVALLDDIKKINERLASIETTLNAHTNILDGITKNP